jgi:hypothetical protein
MLRQFLACMAGGGGLSPTLSHIRSIDNGFTTGVSSYAIANAMTNGAGDFGICSIWWTGDNTTNLSSVTDTAGNTWIVIPGTKSTVVSPTYTYINHQLAYCSSLLASSTNTVTAHWSATNPSYCGGTVHEFHGLTGTLDQATSNTGTSSPISGGTITTTQPNTLIFVAHFEDDSSGGPGDGPGAGSDYHFLTEDASGSAAWGAQWRDQVSPLAGVSGAFAASSNVTAYAASMMSAY